MASNCSAVPSKMAWWQSSSTSRRQAVIRGPDYGIIRMALDGKAVGPAFDLYSGMVGPSGPLELGVHDLPEGEHRFRWASVGKNAVSDHYWFGISAVDLLPTSQDP
jgi:hypothetical protein